MDRRVLAMMHWHKQLSLTDRSFPVFRFNKRMESNDISGPSTSLAEPSVTAPANNYEPNTSSTFRSDSLQDREVNHPRIKFVAVFMCDVISLCWYLMRIEFRDVLNRSSGDRV